jgi:hypothetical protein
MNASKKKSRKHDSRPVDDDLSSHAHRQLIGVVGLLLPPLLWLIAAWRPVEEVWPQWDLLSSVSAYYYTGAVSVFSGALFALAIFLFSYQGYRNEHHRRDRIAATIAGIAAILVAFFPTEAPKDFTAFPWWIEPMKYIHYSAAAALFCSFIFFSIFQFPRSNLKKEEFQLDKQVRNGIYYFCGAAIVVCLLWVVIASIMDGPIFWPETGALEFFAISWLVKGRVDKTAVTASKQTLHYARHPRELANDVRSAIRR